MVAAALAGVNQSSEVGFGLGSEDGTGKFYMAKNAEGRLLQSQPATTDKPMQMASRPGDVNRALTQDELSSIFLSQKPPSGFLAK